MRLIQLVHGPFITLFLAQSLFTAFKYMYVHPYQSVSSLIKFIEYIKEYIYTCIGQQTICLYIHTYTCMFSLTYNTFILNHWLGSCKRIRTMTFIIMLSWPLKYDNCVSWLPHLMTAKVHITAISLYQYGRSRKTPITGRNN